MWSAYCKKTASNIWWAAFANLLASSIAFVNLLLAEFPFIKSSTGIRAVGVSSVLLPALDSMILVVSSGSSNDLSCRQYVLEVYKLRFSLRNLKG